MFQYHMLLDMYIIDLFFYSFFYFLAHLTTWVVVTDWIRKKRFLASFLPKMFFSKSLTLTQRKVILVKHFSQKMTAPNWRFRIAMFQYHMLLDMYIIDLLLFFIFGILFTYCVFARR